MPNSTDVNKHVPGFILHEVLGGGAMSIVFHATEEATGKEKAIKLLRPEHLERADLRQRFEREAKISSTIPHPNIIRVEKYAIHNNIPYMVMPLLDHVTLGDRVEKEGPLGVVDSVAIAIKILDALATLHRENVIHRDLKAENVLYTLGGEPILTDLGLAYAQLDTRITSIGTGPLGTPQYMAPEQWMGETGDRKSDIFATGVLLFYIMTGSFPFPSRSARAVVSQIINGIPDSLPNWIHPTELREELQAVIFKAVSSDPDARYASAREMQKALQEICLKYSELFEGHDVYFTHLISGHGDKKKKTERLLTAIRRDSEEEEKNDEGTAHRKRKITDTNLFKELTKEVEAPEKQEGLKTDSAKEDSTTESLSRAIISTLLGSKNAPTVQPTSVNQEERKIGISDFAENSVKSATGSHTQERISNFSNSFSIIPQPLPEEDSHAVFSNDLLEFQENDDEVTEVIPSVTSSEHYPLPTSTHSPKASDPRIHVHKVQLSEKKVTLPTKDKKPMPPLNDETNPQKLAINPVEIAPGSYWVGKRTPGDFFFANPYLRTFKGNNEEFNLIIDPGSSTDFAIVQAKCSRIIGNLSKINATFINHQDPDVGSSVGPLIGRYSPGAYCLCTEDTWRLVHYYNIPRERFVPLEKYPNGFRLPTGHKLIPVPSPFCHFVGAMMIYDPETCVLYSGDLFGGLTDKNAKGLWADESDWVGVRAFHQIYMPTRGALANAITNIRNIKGEVKIIAPQHGRLLTGDIMHDFMERLQNLSCGLDILSDRQATPDELLAWTTVLNRVLKRASDFTTEDLYAVVLKNGSLEGLINETSNGIEVRKMGKYTIEQALRTICTTIGDKDIEGMIKYEAVYATSELGLPTPNMDIDEGGVPHSKGSMLGSVVD